MEIICERSFPFRFSSAVITAMYISSTGHKMAQIPNKPGNSSWNHSQRDSPGTSTRQNSSTDTAKRITARPDYAAFVAQESGLPAQLAEQNEAGLYDCATMLGFAAGDRRAGVSFFVFVLVFFRVAMVVTSLCYVESITAFKMQAYRKQVGTCALFD